MYLNVSGSNLSQETDFNAKVYMILDFHNNVSEDSSLLESCAILILKYLPTFRKNYLFLFCLFLKVSNFYVLPLLASFVSSFTDTASMNTPLTF